MIRRMEPGDILHGYLYAVSADRNLPFAIEPYLCVETPVGIRFVHSMMLRLDIGVDGPHEVTDETVDFAARHGWVLHPDDLWSRWNQRGEAERVLASLSPVEVNATVDHPVVLEAQQILSDAATPQGQASSWLRNCEHWPGSSLNVLYDHDGKIAGAFVSIYTANPFKLRSLLRWLGVPKTLAARVTGLER
jgi:hypothetical protein